MLEFWVLKKLASNISFTFVTIIPVFQYSIRPHKTIVVKSDMLSIGYINSETLTNRLDRPVHLIPV